MYHNKKKHLTLICSTSSGTVTPLRIDSVADVMSLTELIIFALRYIHYVFFFSFGNHNKSCKINRSRYLLDLVVIEEVKAWTQRIG